MYGAIIGDIVGSRFEFDRGDDTDALGAIAGAMARACILSKMPVWFRQNGSHRRSLWKWLKRSEVLLTVVHLCKLLKCRLISIVGYWFL